MLCRAAEASRQNAAAVLRFTNQERQLLPHACSKHGSGVEASLQQQQARRHCRQPFLHR